MLWVCTPRVFKNQEIMEVGKKTITKVKQRRNLCGKPKILGPKSTAMHNFFSDDTKWALQENPLISSHSLTSLFLSILPTTLHTKIYVTPIFCILLISWKYFYTLIMDVNSIVTLKVYQKIQSYVILFDTYNCVIY